MNSKIRIGQGFDVHRLIEGRKLILGGIEIPHSMGLEGHSDADVLIHAVIDAILGAIGESDIGSHFPNSDSKWKNADSKLMLAEVYSKLSSRKYKIVNLDTNIFAEEPKLRPYIAAICKSLADVLAVEPSQISVKAGTMERMGFVGRKEGIAAAAVVLIEQSL